MQDNIKRLRNILQDLDFKNLDSNIYGSDWFLKKVLLSQNSFESAVFQLKKIKCRIDLIEASEKAMAYDKSKPF